MRRLRGVAGLVVVATVGVACSSAPPQTPPASAGASPAGSTPSPASRLALPASPLTEEQRILHVLNRLGYGPRPGDVDRVRHMGIAAYIERQLHPEGIPDDRVQQALAEYPVLMTASALLVQAYPEPSNQIKEKLAMGQMTPQETQAVFPVEHRPYAITAQLQAAKLTRAVLSERQLHAVMVDFWFNHFNVYSQKGALRWMVPAYEREAIEPYALGRFKELLRATAQHPAMLFYLDNWMSTRADFILPAGPEKGRKLGLNENYAREIMELHTLGVDGGYTQQDVIEVARCVTGWTIDRPQQGGGFLFRPLPHDQGQKRVLGHVIPPGVGHQDGLQVIDILAHHPSTARFIATKLARRFVSDDPPPALVERAAATFRRTDRDIRAVLETIFTAPEFWSAAAYRAKIKSPVEVVVSAVRALDGRLAPPGPGAELFQGGGFVLAREVAKLGEPLYEAQPPTGYPDRAEFWVNTGALLGRMNFALGLAHNRLRGTHVDLAELVNETDRRQPRQVLDRLVTVVLHDQVSPETRAVLAAQLDSPEITRTTPYDQVAKDTDIEKLAALVLGSPEFQRR
jgi:uncharacterized protein (DUF1800 family)